MLDRHVFRGSTERGAVFLGAWLMLAGFQPAALVVGMLAAGMATPARLRL